MNRLNLFLMGILCSFQSVYCQTVEEWVNQTSTQKKYLIQQVAALQVYIGYLSKGYEIARKGLNAIGDIKSGHFKLDEDFFASLNLVNDNIINSKEAKGIPTVYLQCVQMCDRLKKLLATEKTIQQAEKDYLSKIIDACMVEAKQELTSYSLFISPDKLKMTDDERQKKVSDVYAALVEIRSFLQKLKGEIRILSVQRIRTQAEVESTSKYYK